MHIRPIHASVLLAALVVSCSKPSDPELGAYLETIRIQRMTVEARGDLHFIAQVRVQLGTVTYLKDADGPSYSTTFATQMCLRPGLDSASAARFTARNDSTIQAEVERIRSLVDSDSSGFVTTSEASEFRELFMDQLLAQHIAETEHGPEQDFMKAKGFTPDQLTAFKSKYAALYDRAQRMHISNVPPWPFH
jgi:hypothetical protein